MSPKELAALQAEAKKSKKNKSEDIVSIKHTSTGDVAAGIPAVLDELNFSDDLIEINYTVTSLPKRFLSWKQEKVFFEITGPRNRVNLAIKSLKAGIADYNHSVGR